MYLGGCSAVERTMGLSGCRYFSVTRPVLVSVTGATNGVYAHSSTVTVSAQLTALTTSAGYSHLMS